MPFITEVAAWTEPSESSVLDQVVGISLIPNRILPTALESLLMGVCLPPGGDWMSPNDNPPIKRLVARVNAMNFFILKSDILALMSGL